MNKEPIAKTQVASILIEQSNSPSPKFTDLYYKQRKTIMGKRQVCVYPI